jgi:hypothetical protein
MRADKRDPVIAALRRFKPTKFLATLRSGDTRELALSTRANKWELLLDTIGAMPWTRIEALDDKNVVLGAVDQDAQDEPDDDEVIGGEVMALTKIMQQVQASTMVECRRMFESQTRVQAEMAKAMLDGMHAMQEGYQVAIRMTAMSATRSASEDGPGEQDKVMQMIQMAMALKFNTPPPTVHPQPAKPTPAPSKAVVKT